MAKTFTAQLEQFCDLTTKDMRYVATQAIQDVLEGAQTTQVGIGAGASGFEEGKLPVVSSELLNSLAVNDGAQGATAYVEAIAGMEIGDMLTFSWNAPHALRIEAGYNDTDSLGRSFEVPGRFFVLNNAKKFPEFVEARAREVK